MTLSLSEQLLLLSYGDESGKALVPLGHLDYGLSGAQLLEYTYAGKVTISNGKLAVTSPPAGDPVLAKIAANSGHTADWWVYHLADPSRRKNLLASLVTRGVLEEHPHLLRRATFPETDPAEERELAGQLRAVADGTAPPDEHSVALIGLAHAIGLDRHLFPGRDRSALRHRLSELTQADWCGHAVRRIVEAMNVAVLSAVSGIPVAQAAPAAS